MTREEAIGIWLPMVLLAVHESPQCEEAVKMAGRALEQEPCEDAVSRQAVLGCLTATKLKGLKKFDLILHAREEIKKLPPVTPQEPKTGHWRHYEGMLYCSKCGSEFYDEITEYTGDEVPKCCPDCGAKMVEPQEGKDKG